MLCLFNVAPSPYIPIHRHYYVASVVSANGSLAYAAGEDFQDTKRFWAKPKTIPFIHPNAARNRNLHLPICRHKVCKDVHQRDFLGGVEGAVRHGSYCDGSTPQWEAALVLQLLTPGILMRDLSFNCRTLVLASGTLSPIQSLTAELDLNPAEDPLKSSSPFNNGLQVKPMPLEANHVVNLSKQLLAVSVGHFPDGSPLTVTSKNYQRRDWVRQLGHALASVVECIPRGG